MCLGLVILSYLTQEAFLRGIAVACVGLFLSLAGQDVMTGAIRFKFGVNRLSDGFRLIPVMMGLFGISEVFLNLETPQERIVFKTKIKNLLSSKDDWRRSAMPMLEKNLRLALVLSDGNPTVFVKSPISVIALLIALLLLTSAVLPSIRKMRRTVVSEE